MRIRIPSDPHRPGTIAPLAVLLAMFLIGMVAFAVDTSWMVLTQSELQSAADAAALAGSSKIPAYFVKYHLPGATVSVKATLRQSAVSAARQAAQDNAAQNRAGDVSSLTLPDVDIQVGHTATDGVFVDYEDDNQLFPNTVKVTMRRVSGTNNSLKLFFGPALGTNSVDLVARATAGLYVAAIDGVDPKTSGFGMLPLTYDSDFWDYFLKTGKDADRRSNKDGEGLGVLNLYSSGTYKGNFGLISLNGRNANASTNRGWVNDGPSSADLTALTNKNLMPLSKHDASQWDWEGTPGFESSTVQEINSNIGKVFLIPLYKAYTTDFDLAGSVAAGEVVSKGSGKYQAGTGQGSNFNYNVNRFVAVKIVDPVPYGGRRNRDIMVQPANMTSDDFVVKSGTSSYLGTTTPSDPSSYTITVPKLTE